MYIDPRSAPSSGGGADTNIYNTDGTLTANRTLDGDGNDFCFENYGQYKLDSILTATGIFDDDGNTGIYVEESADENRLRFQTFSDFYTGAEAYHGVIDTDGLYFVSFAEDAQVLTADGRADTSNSTTRRAELLVERGPIPDSVPTSGILPGITGASVGSYAMFQVGRDTRVAGMGVIHEDIASGLTQTVGMWSKNFSTEHFIGFQPGASAWIREMDSGGANDLYIRLDSTRLLIVENTTGAGTTSGAVLARDDSHFSGGGCVWRQPFGDEFGRAQVGVTGLANQRFDATLRGMSWGALATQAGGPGGTDNTFAVGKTTSSLSTPNAANLTPADCDAFDFNGGVAPNSGMSHAMIYCTISFELVGASTGESIYELQWWDNNKNLATAQEVKRISFGTEHSTNTVQFAQHWPGPGSNSPGSGSLGYVQLELRIQRISGSDDIQVIDDGCQLIINRIS